MTITTITCGDLAALGGWWDNLEQHDPRKQSLDYDTLCHCYPSRVDASRGANSAHVECLDETRFPVGGEYVVVLCCLCACSVRGALRGIRDRALEEWLAAQCDQAVTWREQCRVRHERRVARYMEAAGVAR